MDEKEFENVFRSSFTFLRNIAFTLVHDDDTARDLVQQVFINLWQKRDSLKVRGNIKPYLKRAVVNTSINYIRKQKKNLLPENIEIYEIPDYESSSDEEKNRQIEKGVKDALEHLSPKCQLVFSLSRYSNMTNKDIAEHLGISVKAVEKNIGKALKELRVSLKPLYKSVFIIFLLIMVGFFKRFLSI
jgi:RNA polymerase sigma-70 factor (ECF subfamily)